MMSATAYSIPRFDLKATYGAMRGEILAAVDAVLQSGTLILGPQVREFEEAMAAHLAARGYAVGVGNGTDALTIALKSLGIGPGDEVITVANTAVGTVSAIATAGARPAFCDIDPATLMMDPVDLKRRITPQTRAIIPVHLFGNAVDMARIMRLAEERSLKVVEDCAQACGTSWEGRAVGTFGHVGCFSFYPTKNLAAYGDGGMCHTLDERHAGVLRELRAYGCDARGEARRHGINSRLDELQAAILQIRLRYLRVEVEARRQIAEHYDRELPSSCVRLATTEGARHSYCLYVVRVRNRAQVMSRLAAEGIECGIHYPIPIHRMANYRSGRFPAGSLPHTERMAEEVLSLPCYPGMTPEAVERVIAVLHASD